MRQILCCLLALMMALPPLTGESRTITDFFASEPGNIFPLLTRTNRLDLVDYWLNGQTVALQNNLAGTSQLVELDDNLLVYANLEDMQRLCGWGEDRASSLEIRLSESADQELLALEIGTLAEDYYVSSSRRTYPQVFDWLHLLDFNVLIILILMTVVAGFNMVSGLLIMLLRNISTVGTLKTLGMDNRSIGRLFVRIGARAVLKGMLIGNAAALLFCLLQGTTHLIPLDPANYFVSWVPVRVHLLWILGADAAAFLGILLLLWIPTRVIARIDPAQTVKAD